MIIKEKIGRIENTALQNRELDLLSLEWFETGRRILHKKTAAGRPLVLKFLNNNPNLTDGDILFEDEALVIGVDILSCDVIRVSPLSMFSMAGLCYEIGNKHLPLYYEEGDVLVPYDAPLFQFLQSSGFQPSRAHTKLLNPVRCSVVAHAHNGNNSLFSRILNLTSSSHD